MIAATLVLSAALLVRERRAADPIVPCHLLRTGPVAVASATLFLATAALFAVTVFVPLFLETTTGASPTQAGLLLVPAMLGIAVSTTLSGRSIAATGRYKRFPIAGLGLMTVALVLLAASAGDPSQVATGIGPTSQQPMYPRKRKNRSERLDLVHRLRELDVPYLD